VFAQWWLCYAELLGADERILPEAIPVGKYNEIWVGSRKPVIDMRYLAILEVSIRL
jgi:hypothetical protein